MGNKPPERRGIELAQAGRCDRTSRVAVAALRVSEEWLSLAMDAAGLVPWDYDIAARRLRWDARLAMHLGVPRETAKAISRDWLSVVHPDDRRRVRAEFLAAVRGRANYDTEFRALRADGAVQWFASKGKTLRHADGAPRRIVGVLQDITARKRTELLARHLSAIVESSDESIVSEDLDGIIATWNKGAERLFGYTAEEAVGKSIAILTPLDRRDEETRILATVRRGRHVDRYETVHRRKDGSSVEISLTVSPVKDATGRVIGASKIAHDITARKRAEGRQALLAREVDHRAKNLLALVQVLVRQTRAETAEDYAEAIQGRIMALAHAHSQLSQSRWEGAELGRLLGVELAAYRDDKGRTRLSGTRVRLVPKAAESIAMAVHELVSNAAKYGALSVSGGRVAIGWSVAPDGSLTLRWTETGGPPVATPTRRGLGMTIIEQSVRRQLGGTISFDWRPRGLVCVLRVAGDQVVRDGA